MDCGCYYCFYKEPHPDDRHPNFHRISSHLLVAESLDPKDLVHIEACETCGHKREVK